MKHYLLFICISISSLAFGQEQLPFFADFEEDDGSWTQYRLGQTEDDTYVWNINEFQGLLQHNYPVGGTLLTNDWIVSPAIDFSNGATIENLDYRFSGFGFPFGEDTIALYLITGSQNPAEAASIELLHLLTDENYSPDFTWYSLTDIAISPTAGQAYIAFRYQTVVNWLDASFDDLQIVGGPLSATEQSREGDLKIYPIPARDVLNISARVPLTTLKIHDLTGSLIHEETITGENVQVELPSISEGLYILEVRDQLGNSLSKRIVVN